MLLQQRKKTVWFPVKVEAGDKSIGKQLVGSTIDKGLDTPKDQVTTKVKIVVDVAAESSVESA